MKTLACLLFFLYMYGLGYGLTFFLRELAFKNLILRFGCGLAAIPVLGLVCSSFHIPLDWRIYLVAAMPGLIISIIRWANGLNHLNFRVDENRINIAVLFLFCINVWIYCHGPFAYPWLEDDDSWGHAAGIKYIAMEKNLNVPSGEFQYLNPYPPGYNLTLGILHQTSLSLYWTMKFFNGLIVAMSFLFFYILALELSRDKRLALAAMFILTCLPSYLSHFIWAHALVIALFFPALFCLTRVQEDRRFLWPGMIAAAAVFLTQPTQSIKFVILVLLFFLAKSVVERRLPWRIAQTILCASLIAMLWYVPVGCSMRQGASRIAVRVEQNPSATAETGKVARSLFNPNGGTATRAYTLNDYLFVPEYNYINSPIGIGWVILTLGLFGLLANIRNLISRNTARRIPRIYSLTVLLWLCFTFLGMNSATFHLPVGLFAFRFWMLFAIPVSLLAAEGLLNLLDLFQPGRKKELLLCIMLLLIILNAGYYKFAINTGFWSYGVYWRTDDEMRAYIWLRRNLPVNTKVFTFLDNFLVIGHDMLAEPWREDYKSAFRQSIALTPEELYKRLKALGYTHIVVGQREIEAFGEDKVNARIEALSQDPRFKLIYRSGSDARVFRVN